MAIADNGFMYLISKKSNLLSIHQDSKGYAPGTTANYLEYLINSNDLKLLGGGFYPREVSIDPINPRLFYLKFQTAIAVCTIIPLIDNN